MQLELGFFILNLYVFNKFKNQILCLHYTKKRSIVLVLRLGVFYFKEKFMNSEQIKRAIARIRDFGLHHAIKDLPHSTYTVEAFELAIECMEKELERQENKALTLSELEEWEGNPVYVISNDGMLNLWEVVIYAREKNSIKCLQSHYNLLDYNFYKHKPTEG